MSDAAGAFTGMAMKGGSIAVSDKANKAYYGKPVKPSDILVDGIVSNPRAEELRTAVAELMREYYRQFITYHEPSRVVFWILREGSLSEPQHIHHRRLFDRGRSLGLGGPPPVSQKLQRQCGPAMSARRHIRLFWIDTLIPYLYTLSHVSAVRFCHGAHGFRHRENLGK